MTVWYDVTDLAVWNLPHLTGIQRTTIGILNGLVENKEPVRLTRFNAKNQTWEPILPTALPPAVTRHLALSETQEAEDSQSTTTTSRESVHKKSQNLKERILGTDSTATELRQAFREFRSTSRQLKRAFLKWSKGRSGRKRPACINEQRNVGHPPTPVAYREAPLHNTRSDHCGHTIFERGDVLLSLGATWGYQGHDEACRIARGYGVVVIRMIYDLIPTLKPQWVLPSHHREITRWVNSLLCNSDCVLTISQFSRREIEKYCQDCRISTPPLSVVRLGDQMKSSNETKPPYPRFVPQRPFFVCVSTIDIRKNHRLLYDAWSVLAARDASTCPDLLCIGSPHLYVADLLREIRTDRAVNARIHVLHDVNDAELGWYYRHAAATIYPSRYEGWGLPVAESLGTGRLCLASHATSIPEISGDLPEFFDPYDVHGLVALIERTLNDEEWVRLREEAIVRDFVGTPWSRTASQVIAAVRQLVLAVGHQAA